MIKTIFLTVLYNLSVLLKYSQLTVLNHVIISNSQS